MSPLSEMSFMHKLNHFLVLIFLLQILFYIKGLNAIPGNVQVSNVPSEPEDANFQPATNPYSLSVENKLIFVEIYIDQIKLNFEGWDAITEAESFSEKQKDQAKLELFVTRVNIPEENYTCLQSPVADRSAYSTPISSSYPLRSKTFSRLSIPSSEDGLDNNFEISGSSRPAYISNSIVDDKELQQNTLDFSFDEIKKKEAISNNAGKEAESASIESQNVEKVYTSFDSN